MTHNKDYVAALEAALRAALKHLELDASARIAPAGSANSLRHSLLRALPDQGSEPDHVVDALVRAVKPGLMRSTSGRFFGWVVGGILPAALAADWLTSAWDQNAGGYELSPAAAVTEEAVGVWLKDLFKLPASAGFALVTGCQMAHVSCLAAARHALLGRRGWNVARMGLANGPRLRVLASASRHVTLDRAVRILGLGEDNIEVIESDATGRVLPTSLRQALQWDLNRPSIVVLQAGELNTGAFDDFLNLIPIAREFGAWVHIDGAFGLWAAASVAKGHLATGAEAADSWATDGHKWLNVPYDCGFAFVREPSDLRAAMTFDASYLDKSQDVRNGADWSPEFSRRARAFPTYAALMQLGRTGVRDLVDRCCARARSLIEGMESVHGVEILCRPTLNQGLVRFLDPRPSATDEQHDRHTDAIIKKLREDGTAFFGGVTWRGRRAMRVSVSNWRTSESDIARTVAAVARAMNPSCSEQTIFDPHLRRQWST